MDDWIPYFIIGTAIWAVIWGFVVKSANENKGYDGGFLLGFFLGFIGLIIVLTKPDLSRSIYRADIASDPLHAMAKEKHRKELIAKGGWVCSNCNTVNPNYVTTCPCGMNHNEVRVAADNPDVENVRPFRICPKCRKMHDTITTKCDCGYGQRSQSQTAAAATNNQSESSVEEKLLSLKKLFDSGVLTQEEYDRKKQQFLDQM